MVVDGEVATDYPTSNGFPLSLEGGVLRGIGVIDVNVQNGGIVAPGSSAGILTIARLYTQTASGALSIEIGGLAAGTEYDRLAVGGVATLDGTLRVEFVNGYVPNVGDHFTIMTYPSKVGNFSDMILPRLSRGKIVEVAVGDTELVVSISSKARPIAALNVVEAFIDAFIP